MSLQGQDNDFDEMVECAKSFHQNGSPHSIRDLSGFPITSGRLIHVPMPSSEAVHLKAMIDLQWAMIVVAAFCGAGGPPQLLPGHEDVDDLDSRIGERVEAHFERHGWTRSSYPKQYAKWAKLVC
ncbi:hypothetical protein BHE90_006716 [Fusarium euwallaceae]|uniref:Uncharacterized protein n=2 Tax=Fusarium solani species complex TaxID=232080 RepID=A0A430LSY2_9HYPO|nr:hypothetical protein CEP51_011014 [Fusarium floridanum]RTE78826.1 hypothetical protein BHE90_006716 [Fusarium euwallaceae]